MHKNLFWSEHTWQKGIDSLPIFSSSPLPFRFSFIPHLLYSSFVWTKVSHHTPIRLARSLLLTNFSASCSFLRTSLGGEIQTCHVLLSILDRRKVQEKIINTFFVVFSHAVTWLCGNIWTQDCGSWSTCHTPFSHLEWDIKPCGVFRRMEMDSNTWMLYKL